MPIFTLLEEVEPNGQYIALRSLTRAVCSYPPLPQVTDIMLNVYRVIILPIYVFVFIDGGHGNLDVSVVNTTYDIWEISDSTKRCFHSTCLALLVEVNVSRHQSGERSSYSMDGSANCRPVVPSIAPVSQL